MNKAYRKQVELLLTILPSVAEESNFALHGGTAINLFENNLPRLSVDIDLTYTTFSDRESDLSAIRNSLENVKQKIKKRIPSIVFPNTAASAEHLKLFCETKDALVKIEVNQINRGLIGEVRQMPLCDKAQEEFDSFCEMNVVSQKQLWGGKIIAALDRQHPRDLFDINGLLKGTRFTEDIKAGFIFFLLCSKRPIHEILSPQCLNQESAFNNQFEGMTDSEFTYQEYEATREELIKIIQDQLTEEEKGFLLAFAKGEPDWSYVDYNQYPAVKWKLTNINTLKKMNAEKLKEQTTLLEKILL